MTDICIFVSSLLSSADIQGPFLHKVKPNVNHIDQSYISFFCHLLSTLQGQIKMEILNRKNISLFHIGSSTYTVPIVLMNTKSLMEKKL